MNLLRLLLLLCIFTFSIIQNSFSASKSNKTNPNVLFIAIEDFNPGNIGCYGGQALTPNIDRFAEGAVVFRNAFCDVAVCNPSRTALLTGLRPKTSGVFGNGTDWREAALPKVGITLPQHFKNNGYETAKVGKIYHFEAPHHESWTVELPEQVEGRKHFSAWIPEVVDQMKSFENKEGGWFNEFLHWGPFDCEPEEFRDGHYVKSVSDYLGQKHEKPFFLAVGFHAPHVKFGAPKEFFDIYDINKIELPDNPINDLDDVPADIGINPIHKQLTDETWREIRLAQFACMSYVDWCIGGVLDALKKNKLDENTIVVIWTDHGFGLGEHWQWSKGGNKLFSEINEVAFIWKVPGVTPEGVHSESVVETIDMFPTLFDLCNIETPVHVQAKSFADVLKDPSLPGKDAAFTWGSPSRVSIQNDRYRLNVDTDLNPASFELYDHKYDPGEFVNVSCNPQYKDVISKLIAHYEEHIESIRVDEN